jgi:hypothetical protein
MRRIVLRYGLIAGAVMAAMLVLTFGVRDEFDFENGAVYGYASMVAAFLAVYFGVRAYRDEVAGGAVSFGRAFGVGLAIVGVGTLCYVLCWQVIYFGFAPDFMERYADFTLAKMRAGGATEEALAAKAKEMADFAVSYRNPLVNMAVTALEPLPVGVPFALLSAWLLSRRRVAGAAAASTPAR